MTAGMCAYVAARAVQHKADTMHRRIEATSPARGVDLHLVRRMSAALTQLQTAHTRVLQRPDSTHISLPQRERHPSQRATKQSKHWRCGDASAGCPNNICSRLRRPLNRSQVTAAQPCEGMTGGKQSRSADPRTPSIVRQRPPQRASCSSQLTRRCLWRLSPAA